MGLEGHARRSLIAGVFCAALATGVSDGLFSSVLSAFFYHSTVMRLWQGVASVLLGAEALKGGIAPAIVGVLMHFGVAFGWSAVFGFGLLRLGLVRTTLRSDYGVLKVAALYGPLIWMVMSLVVIPTLTHRPPTINGRWWVQFFGHIVFVAIPIVAIIERFQRRR